MDEKIDYERRNIYINGDITEDVAKEVIRQIIEINDYDEEQRLEDIYYRNKPISLFLTTNGGDTDEALAIYDVIKHTKTPVNIYALGRCYSAGFVILLAGEYKLAYPNTNFMFHELSYDPQDNCLTTQEYYTQEFRKTQEKINRIVSQNTNISQEKLKEYFEKGKDWFMNAEEALSLGIIDKIIDK